MTIPTQTTIASSMAPSFRTVGRYFVATIAWFVVFSALALLSALDLHGHHFQPKLLALTHAAVLGWVTTIIYGAMFQLVPVVLEVKLFNERWAAVQFWLHTLGTIGMVYGFWFFRTGAHLTASASLVTLAALLFTVNMLLTMARVRKWNLTGLYLLAALLYLALTTVVGLLLAINLGYPFISRIHLDYLKIHAHLGLVGWVVMVIMGVGLKLIPMFGLSHGFSMRPAKLAFVLVNLGLLGTTIEWLLTGPPWLLTTYLAFLVAGVGCFMWQLVLIFHHRMRRVLDLGLKHSAVAFGYLVLSTALGAGVAFAGVENQELREGLVLAYGFAVIIGFFSMLIVGQMYKIVPFLVWFHTFSDRAGKEPVPLLKDMVNENLAVIQYRILQAAVPTAILGFAVNSAALRFAGLGLLLVSSILFSVNIVNVLLMKVRYGNKRTSS